MFVRHGEMGDHPRPHSEVEIPPEGYLTDLGIQQARMVTRYLERFSFRAIYSSPYGRAYQTGYELARRKGMAIKILEWFREFSMGDVHEDLPEEKRYMEETWENPEGWESCLGFAERVRNGMRRLLREYGICERYGGFVFEGTPEGTLLFFGHGGSIGEALKYLLGIPPSPRPFVNIHCGAAIMVLFKEIRGVHYPVLSLEPPFFPDFPGWEDGISVYN